jgi:hypothetical protein
MEVGSPSRTAIHRAAHFLIDDRPKILADSFARAFAGFSSDNEFLAAVDSYAFPDFVAHRASFALRNQYAEDKLAAAAWSGSSSTLNPNPRSSIIRFLTVDEAVRFHRLEQRGVLECVARTKV